MSNLEPQESRSRIRARRQQLSRSSGYPKTITIKKQSRGKAILETLGAFLLIFGLIGINIGLIAILPINKDGKGLVAFIETIFIFLWIAWGITGAYESKW